jgi:biopolymer transport protein ExbB/TolQ
MVELFYEGGALFMGILTLLFLVAISLSVIYGNQIRLSKTIDVNVLTHRLTYIKSVGLFSLVFGVLGSLLGLFEGFGSISQVGSVPPEILMGGIQIAMITTIYGVIIFLISHIIWFALDSRMNKGEI